MIPAIRSEFRKFFTTRLWWGMAIAVFVAGAAFAALFGVIVAQPDGRRRPRWRADHRHATPRSPTPSTPAALSIGYLLLLTIGVLAIGAEYRHKTITATFLATPRRARAMVAKVVALLGHRRRSTACSAWSARSVVGADRAAASATGPAFPSADDLRTLALSLLVLGLWALIGLGIGILIPNQVAALLIGVGVAWIVEPLIGFAARPSGTSGASTGPVPAQQATSAIVNAVSQQRRRGAPGVVGRSPGARWPTPRCSPGSASGGRRAPTSADVAPAARRGPPGGCRRRRPVRPDPGGPAVAARAPLARPTACGASSGDRLGRHPPRLSTSRERGASSVAEQSPSSDPLTAFGPNEWLVDELYEQYTKDRNSVDQAWWEFFKDYTPGEGALGRDAASAAPRPAAGRRRAGGSRGNGSGTRDPGQGPDPAPAAHPRRATRQPAAPAAPAAGARAAAAAAAPAPAPTAAGPAGQGGRAAPDPSPRHPPPRSRARPPPPRAPARSTRPGHPAARRDRPRRHQHGVLARGARPRPACAPCPAKLLIDNRVVINNHLARSRGGKVSFTHIIGYAMVKALGVHARDEQRLRRRRDGKPVLVTPGPRQPRPGHRHGQARRHPPAARAAHQGRRDDGLRPLLDRLRGRSSARPAATS